MFSLCARLVVHPCSPTLKSLIQEASLGYSVRLSQKQGKKVENWGKREGSNDKSNENMTRHKNSEYTYKQLTEFKILNQFAFYFKTYSALGNFPFNFIKEEIRGFGFFKFVF